MKKTLLIFLSTLTVNGFSQLNLGVEAWTSDDPDYWNVSTNLLTSLGAPITVSKETTNPATGANSAKIHVESCPFCPFAGLPDPMPGGLAQVTPYTDRPTEVWFKWRGNIATGDTGAIGARLRLGGSTIGEGFFYIMPGTSQATWLTQMVTISYSSGSNPDTLLFGGVSDRYILKAMETFTPPPPGATTSTSTVVYMDDLYFTLIGVNEVESNNEMILAFPNPTNTMITFNVLGTDAYAFEISDLTGKIIYSETNMDVKHKLDVSGYNNGSYLVRFLNKEGSYIGSSRFVVSK